jgi:hypothetical protein
MEAVGKQIYRLKFSSTYFRIHDIFHIFLLEFYYNRKDRTSTILKPISIKKSKRINDGTNSNNQNKKRQI